MTDTVYTRTSLTEQPRPYDATIATRQAEVAKTIIDQLGGQRFAAMTGAKGWTALQVNEQQDGGVQFRIGRNAKSIHWVRVTLTYADTYTMEFGRGYKTSRVVSTFEDIYCDQLRGTFEDATGLYTSL